MPSSIKVGWPDGRGRQERNCDKEQGEVKPTQRKQLKLWKKLQRSIHSDVDFVVVEEGREVGREEERKPYIVEPSVGKKLNSEGGYYRVGFPYSWGGGQGWGCMGNFCSWGNGEWLGPWSQYVYGNPRI